VLPSANVYRVYFVRSVDKIVAKPCFCGYSEVLSCRR
jgi:hypothetical protein